jgi:hypothetical protein
LPVVKAKLDEARAKGDQALAATHQGWLDRLLEMRIVAARQKTEVKENA